MKRIVGWIFLLVCWPLPVWATQRHAGPEGLYAHQMAHLFFMFAMGFLIYWLRKRHLVATQGWRYIQYAALFFIAWNADAFVSHWLEEQSTLIMAERIGMMQIRISLAPGFEWMGLIYYLTKLDHLLCVPALAFLFLGLRRLLNSPPSAHGLEERTP